MSLVELGQLPKHVRYELEALQAVRHPNVVSLLNRHEKGYGVTLALEYCVTDLRKLLHLLEGQGPLQPALAKAVVQELLLAIHACHQAGFMHRDVTPSNVLIAEGSGLVKLADFGQARRAVEAASEGSADKPSGSGATAAGGPVLSPHVGTRWYKAPELLFGSRSYTPAVDLWGAGCVFAELLTGQALFPGSSDIDQICRIHGVLGSITQEAWPGVVELPDWGKLSFPPSQAKPLAQVLPGAPPAALELLQGLLRYDPDRRLTAAAALQAPYFREHPPPAPPQALAALVQQLVDRSEQQRQQQQQELAAFLSGGEAGREGGPGGEAAAAAGWVGLQEGLTVPAGWAGLQ
ncbi:hypothetical protein N2152v2_009209 [Parachlorella kessleri]